MKPSYYPLLIINYGIALIVGIAVKKVTIALDRKHGWHRDIWRRALLQLVFGVIMISILSFFLVWIYFLAFGQDIVASGYLDYELPFSIALITILNFYYTNVYFYTYPKLLQKMDRDKEQLEDMLAIQVKNGTQVMPPDENKTYILRSSPPIEDADKIKNSRQVLIVEAPGRNIPIKVKDVSMFFIYEKTTFIRLAGVNNLNNCLQFPLRLSDVMDLLDEHTFFRINRQCILNFNAIDSFSFLGEKSILVTLKSEFGKLENLEKEEWDKLTKVSVDNVPGFKEWIKR